jgi:uncharacterized membrane protein
MRTIEQDIDIDAPVDVAYQQWTQFEDFPRFMKNVTQVRQLDDTRLLWTAEIGGREHTWEAKIIEQQPNQRISWRATEGLMNGGTVDFRPENGGDRTHVHVHMEYEPEGLLETIGSTAKIDEIVVGADLKRFKELVEERRLPTGKWQGRIESGRVTEGDK